MCGGVTEREREGGVKKEKDGNHGRRHFEGTEVALEGREHTSVKEAHERSSAIYLFCDCNVFFYACVLILKRIRYQKSTRQQKLR